jgi:BirA family biotin operon repressor/biotin-[acetyl-CoA-carboxylase] ligase
VAEQQLAGRGRQGRSWHSAPGENLLVSVLARTECPPARLPPLALVVGLAVRDAVSRAAPGVDVGIKWPNDVMVRGAPPGIALDAKRIERGGRHGTVLRKVAGILVEAITVGARVEAVVIGIGINVHAREFPPELADRATSVALCGGALLPPPPPPDRGEILADVLATLDRDLHLLPRGLGLFRARLEAADLLRGRPVRVDSGDAGVACGIDDDGRLCVRRADGVLAHWSAGEVHIVS